MSARPDLTTEELIFHWEVVAKTYPEGTLGEYARATAERLRSERPVVTPEMIEEVCREWSKHGDCCFEWDAPPDEVNTAQDRDDMRDDARKHLEKVLSVSSTKGKP